MDAKYWKLLAKYFSGEATSEERKELTGGVSVLRMIKCLSKQNRSGFQ